jgi:proteasome lid subunit RPN8/RPN11
MSEREGELILGGWEPDAEPDWAPFPGPATARSRLRVAVESEAYAGVVAHARQSLQAEVCGVLVGRVGQDERGLYLRITDLIQGEETSAGSKHVTFTQETWTRIHETLERDHRGAGIVGWYHSHPGFGVEFSEMDRFIHENFFPGPGRVALVTDPLGGEDAFIVNTEQGIHYLERVWIDGRERRCFQPAAPSAPHAQGPSADPLLLEQLHARMAQLIQVVDTMQNSWYRLMLTVGVVVVTVAIAAGVWTVIQARLSDRKPPERLDVVPVAVTIEGEEVLLGVELEKWRIPTALRSDMQKALEKAEKRLLEQQLEIERLEQENLLMKQLLLEIEAQLGALPAPAKPKPDGAER